jgi:hypothetical protein
MKNLKIVLAFMMLATFIVSCDDDGGTSSVDLAEGAIPNFTFSDTHPTIIDLNVVSAGTHMEFGYTVDVFQGNVASADVVGFYKTTSGDVYGPVTFETGVTTFPASFTITTNEIIAAFSELNDLSDFNLADELVLTTIFQLTDGRELKLWDDEGNRLYGSDIHTSAFYKVVASYPVGCPLNGKFTGDYKVTLTSDGSGFGPFSDAEFTATLKETSQTLRTFSVAYLPAVGPFNTNVSLEFVCDKVLISGDSGVGCGGGAITFGSTDGGAPINFDEDEDNFSITFTDLLTDGGCGVGAVDATLTFEKI